MMTPTSEVIDVDRATYLERFDVENMPLEQMWSELDRVWDAYGLDNSKPMQLQSATAAFYGHPVWALNGLFSESHDISRGHRNAMADFAAGLGVRRIADFGGGYGTLARALSVALPDASIDVVEPFLPAESARRLEGYPGIRLTNAFEAPYDLVISQDVLEHLDNPVDTALTMVRATRQGGYLIFANCFYPLIKCHLTPQFYLRHTFHWLMRVAGLAPFGQVAGAEHALCYRRVGPDRGERVIALAAALKPYGPLINRIYPTASLPARAARKLMRLARAGGTKPRRPQSKMPVASKGLTRP